MDGVQAVAEGNQQFLVTACVVGRSQAVDLHLPNPVTQASPIAVQAQAQNFHLRAPLPPVETPLNIPDLGAILPIPHPTITAPANRQRVRF